jgi:hypothetical protein
MPETNKSKRFETFLQSACDVMLVFYNPTGQLYAEYMKSQAKIIRVWLETPPLRQ